VDVSAAAIAEEALLEAEGVAVGDEASDDEEVLDPEVGNVEGTKPRNEGTGDSKPKPKKLSKQKQKELEKKLEEEAEAARNAKPLTKEEKAAEKLRLQRLSQEADMAVMGEMFQQKMEEGRLDAEAIQGVLSNVPLESEEQFKDLAQAVGHRVEVEDKPFLAKEFLKEIARQVGRALSGDDLVEVISVLNVVKNEKIKAQLNKKKKKPNKKFANVSREKDDYDFSGADARGIAHAASYTNEELDGDFM